MTDVKQEPLDWAFWFYWIMATTLGWIAGWMIPSVMPVVISGVAVAAFQWTVLYKRIEKAWRWLLFSSLGWLLGYILNLLIFNLELGVFSGVMLGGISGIFQWIILRDEVSWAGWWIIVSIIAWTTGLVVIPGFLSSGALPGAFTGLTLIILFRFSKNGFA